jgi:hypothetical protein
MFPLSLLDFYQDYNKEGEIMTISTRGFGATLTTLARSTMIGFRRCSIRIRPLRGRELGPQIHAISDETRRKIHALLTDHQKELEKAMQQREHNGGENRRPGPPAAGSPEPSSSASARQAVLQD